MGPDDPIIYPSASRRVEHQAELAVVIKRRCRNVHAQRVREYVLGQPETKKFLRKLDDLFSLLLPAYVKEGKSYLSIAVGCTGGRHRSVVLAEELAGLLRKRGFEPTVHHRDLDR